MCNLEFNFGHVYLRLRQGKDQIYYVSSETSLTVGEGFAQLWKDISFRGRIQAVIIDKAHCIEEWGDEFRESYKNLAKLRDYIGPTLLAAISIPVESHAATGLLQGLLRGPSKVCEVAVLQLLSFKLLPLPVFLSLFNNSECNLRPFKSSKHRNW